MLPPRCVLYSYCIQFFIEPLDFVHSRFVALKITVAYFRLARTRLLVYSNSSHVAMLSIYKLKGRSMYLDNFQIQIQGPNWTHEVFVTEVVASLSDRPHSLSSLQECETKRDAYYLFETYLVHLSSSENLSYIKHS